MLLRDFVLVAGTAAISSFVTYLVTDAAVDESIPVHASAACEASVAEVSAAGAAQGGHSSRMDDDTPGSPADRTPAVSMQSLKSNPPQPQRRADGAGETDAAQNTCLQFYRRQQHAIDEFIQLHAKAGSPDSGALSAGIEERFHQETLDPQWAPDKENEILGVFEKHEGLSAISPLYVTCKSKNCVVALSATGLEQTEPLTRKFFEAMMHSDIGMKNKSISYFPDPATGRLLFYLSDNGNMDLFSGMQRFQEEKQAD